MRFTATTLREGDVSVRELWRPRWLFPFTEEHERPEEEGTMPVGRFVLASHEITSFGPFFVRVVLSLAGGAATLGLAPVLRALYARPSQREQQIRPVEVLVIAVLVALSGMVALAKWDATASLG